MKSLSDQKKNPQHAITTRQMFIVCTICKISLQCCVNTTLKRFCTRLKSIFFPKKRTKNSATLVHLNGVEPQYKKTHGQVWRFQLESSVFFLILDIPFKRIPCTATDCLPHVGVPPYIHLQHTTRKLDRKSISQTILRLNSSYSSNIPPGRDCFLGRLGTRSSTDIKQ